MVLHVTVDLSLITIRLVLKILPINRLMLQSTICSRKYSTGYFSDVCLYYVFCYWIITIPMCYIFFYFYKYVFMWPAWHLHEATYHKSTGVTRKIYSTKKMWGRYKACGSVTL